MDFEKLFEEANDVDVKIKELKRCPFCGGEAAILHYPRDGYLPHCTECDGMVEKWFNTPEEAFEAWNRRTDDGLSGSDTLHESYCKGRSL